MTLQLQLFRLLVAFLAVCPCLGNPRVPTNRNEDPTPTGDTSMGLFGGDDLCFPELDCFNNKGAWKERPFRLLPNSPERIGLKFLLVTRATKNQEPELLDYRGKPLVSLSRSHFNPNKKTVAISHGFLSGGPEWFAPFIHELLELEDMNVICVDWGSYGGSKTLYNRATANTRVVGAALGVLIWKMVTQAGADPSKFHLVGHSLGAHVCGYAGAKVEEKTGRKVGRITGLDPAEPNFETYSSVIRLDPSDADFVDVIHTDGNSASHFWKLESGGYGMRKACGHADFYPNGGDDQPGCSDSEILGLAKKRDTIPGGLTTPLKDTSSEEPVLESEPPVLTPDMIVPQVSYGIVSTATACDHSRSVALFLESINDCSSHGYRCSDIGDFYIEKCPATCRQNRCNKMGYHATKPSSPETYYLFTTKDENQFCAKQYNLVNIVFDGKTAGLKGDMLVSLEDRNGLTSHKANFTLTGDGHKSYSVKTWWTIESPAIKHVDLHWEEDTAFYWKALCVFGGCSFDDAGIKRAEVLNYKTGEKQSFCGGIVHHKKDKKLRLYPSPSCDHL